MVLEVMKFSVLEVIGLPNRALRFNNGSWHAATLGANGEYLLPLWNPEQPLDFSQPLPVDFDLQLEGEIEPVPVPLEQFEFEETAFLATGLDEPADEAELETRLTHHQLRTIDGKLKAATQTLHGFVTSELHRPPRQRVIWEVYAGESRVSAVAESLGAKVQIFGPSTSWNFDLKEHRKMFLDRLEREVPDEVLRSPTCGPWSPMQNLNARTSRRQEQLQDLREWHHEIHLKFVKKIYETQVRNGAHCHVEQPAYALSWKTWALSNLPGYHCIFHQCRYGSQCPGSNGEWLYVKKPTALRTTKMAVYQQFQLQCEGGHEHCPLEGCAKGYGLRTRYLENYQPAFATVLAASLMAEEIPTTLDFVGAVNEDRKHTGELVKLLAENRQDAVRTVQRLHRNLGHPDPSALVELLSSRGASQMILDVASNYRCSACERYKKPNATAPAAMSKATTFNEQIQADVMWLKLPDTKVPVLHIIDVATKFQAAAVVYGEKSSDYQHALERVWIRHFGPPSELHTDEGRGWCSEEMYTFLMDLNIHHTISPGEAHTRLGVLERRHSVLRKALEIYTLSESENSRWSATSVGLCSSTGQLCSYSGRLFAFPMGTWISTQFAR